MRLHLVDATYELFRAHFSPRPPVLGRNGQVLSWHERFTDRNADVRSRRHAEVSPRVVRIEHHVRRRDLEPPPDRHGVACVDREVHDHLLQLAGVGFDVPCRRVEGRVYFDIFPD